MLESKKGICPECGSNISITDKSRGEIKCDTCGTVLQQKFIDTGPEWRAFTSEEVKNRVRTGTPMTLTLYDKGLSTIIDKKNKDSFGRSLSPKTKAVFYRLRKWQERTKKAKALERNLSLAMEYLDKFGSQLNLTKEVKESAAYYYRKLAKKGIIKGRSIEGMILAAYYVALKINRRIINLNLINEISTQGVNTILKYSKVYQNVLNLTLPPTNPQELIPYYCSELSLSGQVQSKAIGILRKLQIKMNFSGKSPSGLASAALYFASLLNNERRSQKEISKVAGVTEQTLRRHYRILNNNLISNNK